MNELSAISIFVCICSSLILLISNREKELSLLISSTVYILIMIYAVSTFGEFFEAIKEFLNGYDEFPNINVLIRLGGIAIVSTISSSICESEGQKVFSGAIEIFAAIEILKTGLPIAEELFSSVLKLFGE